MFKTKQVKKVVSEKEIQRAFEDFIGFRAVQRRGKYRLIDFDLKVLEISQYFAKYGMRSLEFILVSAKFKDRANLLSLFDTFVKNKIYKARYVMFNKSILDDFLEYMCCFESTETLSKEVTTWFHENVDIDLESMYHLEILTRHVGDKEMISLDSLLVEYEN